MADPGNLKNLETSTRLIVLPISHYCEEALKTFAEENQNR